VWKGWPLGAAVPDRGVEPRIRLPGSGIIAARPNALWASLPWLSKARSHLTPKHGGLPQAPVNLPPEQAWSVLTPDDWRATGTVAERPSTSTAATAWFLDGRPSSASAELFPNRTALIKLERAAQSHVQNPLSELRLPAAVV